MVIDKLLASTKDWQTDGTAEPVVYFYCNRNEPDRRDPTVIMQAIVKQLSLALPQAGLPKPVVNKYDVRAKDGFASGPLEFQECYDLVVSLLDLYPRTTIIIDGLDESDDMERWRLLEALASIMRTSVNPVKIFISSRDDGDIKLELEKLPNLYIAARDNRKDIQRYVEREVKREGGKRRLWQLPHNLQMKIISTMVEKANGM